MIDLHTHILPALDDGALDLTAALAMASAAAADGVAEVVATPHSGMEGVSRPRVEQQAEVLRAALAASGIPLRLSTGLEVWLAPDVADRQRAGELLTIDGGHYMLVELPIQQVPLYADQAIFALQLAGIAVVLAHPERYIALEESLDPLYRWVERGVLCQITAASLFGAFGPRAKETAERMLAHNLAHVIASDAHSADLRPPVLAKAAERAAELVGAEQAWAMVTSVPERIVAGLAIEKPEPLPLRSKRCWLPWRR